MARRKQREQAQYGGRLKKYLVTILPTIGPVEVFAENEEEAEEWANHYWDTNWDGEFVADIKELKESYPKEAGNEA